MPLAKSHSMPSKKDRKPRYYTTPTGRLLNLEEYNETEKVLDKLYYDICNGVSRSECMQRLRNGTYGKEMKKRNATDYYNAALARLEFNADLEAKQLRDLLYNRYETILEECMKKGDVFNARATLDSIAKIFLGVKDSQTNIQLNTSKDGGITINFGFGENKSENKSNDIEDGEIIVDEDVE